MASKQKPEPLPSSEWIAMNPDGVTWTDLIVTEDPRFPDEDRIAAIDWLFKKWFARPIAPQRFMALEQRILTALKDRAGAHETTPEAELQQSVIQALLLALGEMEDIGDIFAPEPRKEIWKRLNNLVVEDLLAPEWRHVPSEDIEHLSELEYQEKLEGLEEFLLVEAGHGGQQEGMGHVPGKIVDADCHRVYEGGELSEQDCQNQGPTQDADRKRPNDSGAIRRAARSSGHERVYS